MKKISVIIPMYNMEHYIVHCIESILQQTYPNLEILVINDGSTDHSVNLLQKFLKEDSRIKLINKVNGGLNSAVCCGIENATGDYVIFVDADDYIGKDFVSSFLANLVDEDCIAMGFYYSDNNKKTEFMLEADKTYELESLKELNENFLYDVNLNLSNKIFISRWNKMYKLDVLKRFVDFYNKFQYMSFGEDTIFIYFLLQNVDSIKTIKECNTYYYNVANQNSMTSVLKGINKINEEFKLILKFRDDLKQLQLRDTISNMLIYYLGLSYVGKYKLKEKKEFKSFLKSLCHNEVFHSSLKNIPIKKLSFKGKIKVFLLKHKWVSLYSFFA